MKFQYPLFSGINADALAIQDKTTSGRAIALRIKQAVTILSSYFRNFRYTKEMVGTAIFANPRAPLNILEGIERFMKKEDVHRLSELIGAAI